MKSIFAKRTSRKQKEKMIQLYNQGYCAREIARRLKINANAVWNLIFDKEPPAKMSAGEKRRISKLVSLTESQVKAMRKQACRGVPSTVLAETYNISKTTALSCIKGRTYRWIPGPTIPHFKVHKPISEQDIVYLSPIEAKTVKRRKGEKSGPKKDSVRMVNQRELIRVAKNRGMSPCTVSKWLHKGKINAVDGKIDLRTVPKIKARIAT